MSAPTRIYQGIRPAWERHLLDTTRRALIEYAHAQLDPADALDLMFDQIEATDWEPALALTLPGVPEQFRHLWTQERARDLLEGAFILATLKLNPDRRGRLMRDAIIPALELSGGKVEAQP